MAGNEVLSNNGLPSTNANAATLGYSYDSAGHLQSVSSSLNDAEHPEVLFQATNYSAVGLTGASYALPTAEGTPAYNQALTYDTRLRLTGETDTATTSTANLPYSYTVSYDGAGNATNLTDSLMGTWTYTPDALNRLLTAVSSAGTYAGLTLTESYDVYGNRTNQVPSGSYGGPVPSAMLLIFNGNNNRADQWSYDAAGHVLNDGTNMYEYDAEGRQTGVYNTLTGLTGYIYDAEGQRVMKVVVNGFGGPNPSTTVTKEYLLGPNGEQISVLDGSGNWQWTNVYAGTRQLATYDSAGTHFTITDWLGTKRMQLGVTAASTVTVGERCTSLPYGDGLDCTGSDVNQLYFTGKERDTESGNDYFLARYYSSNMGGRFLTPDWSKNPQGVPYANYTNPQTLNLYAYVGDNPLSLADADGHDGCTDTTNAPCELKEAAKKNSKAEQSKSQQQSWLGRLSAGLSAAWTSAIKTYETYTKVSPETSQVYSGRTSGTRGAEQNVAARDANHHMNEEGYGPAQLDKSSTNRNAIRGREQQLIEQNGGAKSEGGTSGNAINGISQSNPNRGDYMGAAGEEFGPLSPRPLVGDYSQPGEGADFELGADSCGAFGSGSCD